MSATDQRMTRVTGTGSVTTGRTRLHSIYYIGSAGGGAITLKNTDNSGTTLFNIDVPATSASVPMQIFLGEESGIVFPGGIYCAAMISSSATLFYST